MPDGLDHKSMFKSHEGVEGISKNMMKNLIGILGEKHREAYRIVILYKKNL
jgi:hypothetical protein